MIDDRTAELLLAEGFQPDERGQGLEPPRCLEPCQIPEFLPFFTMLRWVEENSIGRGPRSSAMSLSIFAIGAPTRGRSACWFHRRSWAVTSSRRISSSSHGSTCENSRVCHSLPPEFSRSDASGDFHRPA